MWSWLAIFGFVKLLSTTFPCSVHTYLPLQWPYIPSLAVTIYEKARDDLVNPFWAEDKGTGEGDVVLIGSEEVEFWRNFIEKYLAPLDKSTVKQEKVRPGSVCCVVGESLYGSSLGSPQYSPRVALFLTALQCLVVLKVESKCHGLICIGRSDPLLRSSVYVW